MPQKNTVDELRENPQIQYIFDTHNMIIHKKVCCEIDHLPAETLKGLPEPMPKKIKYCPCEKCMPILAQQYKDRTTGLNGKRLVFTRIKSSHKPYVWDAQNQFMHRSNSPCIYNRPIRFLTPTDKIFENHELCPKCFSDHSPEKIARQVQYEFRRVKNINDYEGTFEAIKSYCSKNFMIVAVVDYVVYITTIAGQWYFDIRETPVDLYHRNYRKTPPENYTNTLVVYDDAQYHKQEIVLKSVQEALTYIVNHDESMILRLVRSSKDDLYESDNALAQFVRNRMEDCGIPKDREAASIGVTQEAWSNYQSSGYTTMPLQVLHRLSETINIDMDVLFDGIAKEAERLESD